MIDKRTASTWAHIALVRLVCGSLGHTIKTDEPLHFPADAQWVGVTEDLPGPDGTLVPTEILEVTLTIEPLTLSPYHVDDRKRFCDNWRNGGTDDPSDRLGKYGKPCPLTGKDDITVRAFNGTLPGPTLRMQRCHTYRINYHNHLGPQPTYRSQANAMKPNSTNIHTHGLHVSPEIGADFVLDAVGPGHKKSYLYRIPCDHMGGTFWYHPHTNSSSLQLGGGAWGMIIVEDEPVDGLPGVISNMPELPLLLHLFDPRTLQGLAFTFGDNLFRSSILRPSYLVNGHTIPTIKLRANEWTRLRVAHVALQAASVITISDEAGLLPAKSCELKLLAKDGVYLLENNPRAVGGLDLNEASRADVAVRCSRPQPLYLWVNTTILHQGIVEAENGGWGQTEHRLQRIADIQVTPTMADPIELPYFKPCFPWYLRDLRNHALDANSEVVQDVTRGTGPRDVWMGMRSVGGYRFHDYSKADYYSDPGGWLAADDQKIAIARHFRSNRIYEFNLIKNAMFHPFHIHVWHFQLQAGVDGEIPNRPQTPGYHQPGDWHDTWSVTGPAVSVRLRTARFGGAALAHCHVLQHEGRGAIAPWMVHGGINATAFPAAINPPQCAVDYYSSRSYVASSSAKGKCSCDDACVSVGDCCQKCKNVEFPRSCGYREFTWDELSKHHLPDDLLMAVEGYVYNFTDFLRIHPGGWQPYLPLAGHDATAQFHAMGVHQGVRLRDFVPCLGPIADAKVSDPTLYLPPRGMLFHGITVEERQNTSGWTWKEEQQKVSSQRPKSEESHSEDTDFDFIIVGSGSSGSALAYQLSSNPDIRVLVIEEGPWAPYDPHTHSNGFGNLYDARKVTEELGNSHAARPYYTEPMRGYNNRSVFTPRFKATGGCSLHNYHVLVHPNYKDFNSWAFEHGNPEWSWRHLAPYGRTIHAMYKAVVNDDFSHYPYLDEMMSACLQTGMTENAHPNPTMQKGCNLRRHIDLRTWSWKETPTSEHYGWYTPRVDSCSQRASLGGTCPVPKNENAAWEEPATDPLSWWLRRQSAFSQFLQPALHRPNLKVMTMKRIEKVLFDQTGDKPRAMAVRVRSLTDGGGVQKINARKEVILSGGVFNSPQILMLSGIGPRKHLEEFGIPVVADLPGVGSDLTNDGYCEVTGPKLKDAIINSTMSFSNETGKKEWSFTKAAGKWATAGMQAWDQNSTVPRWDVTFHVALKGDNENVPTLVAELEPLSWSGGGSVRLRSANPADQPRITSYDNDPDTPEGRDDMSKWLESLRFIRKLFASPAMHDLIDPDSGFTSPTEGEWAKGDDGLKEFVRSTCRWDAGHGQGTNPMGPKARPGTTDRQTVVDGRLRVHGIDGLRVVDASIFPGPVHGNTNQPAVLVGLRAGTLIEEDHYGKVAAAATNKTFSASKTKAFSSKGGRRLEAMDSRYNGGDSIGHVLLLHLVGCIVVVIGGIHFLAYRNTSSRRKCGESYRLP